MVKYSESDDPDERESSEPTDADESEGNRPKEPILFLLDSFERSFRRIDDLYARYEEFPGRVRFALGIVGFLSSAYLGSVVKRTVDATAGSISKSLVGSFTAFSLGIQIVLPILALIYSGSGRQQKPY
jgi:hypothetical protein